MIQFEGTTLCPLDSKSRRDYVFEFPPARVFALAKKGLSVLQVGTKTDSQRTVAFQQREYCRTIVDNRLTFIGH